MVHVFIVNPKSTPIGYAQQLREKLAQIPDLTYYVFTTREAGYETELARMSEEIFEGEQLRLYCCGGQATARNIMNGCKDLSRIEIAIIPTNPGGILASYSDWTKFQDVENMIYGDIEHVDYFKTNNGVALNTISVGMSSFAYYTAEKLRGFRAFGKNAPFILSMLHTILFAPNHTYNLYIDGTQKVQTYADIMINNIPAIKFDKDNIQTVNNDGRAICQVAKTYSFIRRIIGIINISKIHDAKSAKKYGIEYTVGSTFRIRRENGASMWGSMDGELVASNDWSIEVVRQGLRFVVPKGVSHGIR